jgi:hypothetical protein
MPPLLTSKRLEKRLRKVTVPWLEARAWTAPDG